MSGKVDIRQPLEFGWKVFRENVLFFLVMMLILGIPAAIMGVMVKDTPWLSLSVLFLRGVAWLWRVIAAMAVILVSLSYCDRNSFDIRQAEAMKPLFIPYLLGSILFSVMIGVGMVLLVVPGVYLAVRYQFMPYLIIDKGMQPMDALRAAGELTRGSWLDLFIFLLCIVGINLLGALLLGLGLLVTVPVTFVAHASVYRSFVPAGQ
jgi:uncharacterized membrane protein